MSYDNWKTTDPRDAEEPIEIDPQPANELEAIYQEYCDLEIELDEMTSENTRLKSLLKSASDALVSSSSTVAVSGVVAMPTNPTVEELIKENARIKSLLTRAADALEERYGLWRRHSDLIEELRKAAE